MRRRRGNGLTQHTHSLGREKVHGTVAPLSIGHFRAVPDRRIRLSQETMTTAISLSHVISKMMMIIIVLQKRNRSVPHAGMYANVTKYAESSGWMDYDAQHNSYSCAKKSSWRWIEKRESKTYYTK